MQVKIYSQDKTKDKRHKYCMLVVELLCSLGIPCNITTTYAAVFV